MNDTGTSPPDPGLLYKRLLDLVHSMSSAPDQEVALAVLVQASMELVPCDGVSVMWLEEGQLRVLFSSGPTAASTGLILPAGQMGAARSLLDSGQHVLVADTSDDVRWQPVPGEERVRSWLGVPLLLDERTLGLLAWTGRVPGRFGESDVAAATEIAHIAAPVLYRQRMMDSLRRRVSESAELQASTAGARMDGGDDLLAVVNDAREYTGARHAFVFVQAGEGGQLHCAAAAGDLRHALHRTALRGDGTLGGWPTSTGDLRGRRGSGPSDRQMLRALGIKGSPLIQLLRAGGQPLGIIGIAERTDGSGFGQDAVRILTHLANRAATVLERTDRADQEPLQYDYEMIVQSSPLAIAVLTQAGEIRFCNPGLTALLSCTKERLLGSNLAEFLAVSDRQCLSDLLKQVVTTGQRGQVDVQLSTQGDVLHARVSLAPAQLSEDAGGSLVSILEDVTSLKILEEERVQHLRELGEKHDQLKELDQLRSRFISNVSHDLRTPLAVIKLYATLAQKGRPEKRPQYLLTIEQETRRLETMVENVLDVTRIDRQTLQIHPEQLDTEEIIAEVLGVYGETAKKKGIGLTNAVRRPLSPLWADKNHLVQMLTNLVDNALKYTARGGQVWVGAQEIRSDGPPKMEISVGDTGTGIPEDEQSKVFERFFRGSNNSPASKGTGLGLAIVSELMAHHGGRVTLSSRPGVGSIFALQFPLLPHASPSDTSSRAESRE